MAPNRSSILLSAALAVVTPFLAGAMAWHYVVDDDLRSGVSYVLLYWPSILLSHLPPAAADAFTMSALPMVLLYFAGYLALVHGVRVVWRRWRRAA